MGYFKDDNYYEQLKQDGLYKKDEMARWYEENCAIYEQKCSDLAREALSVLQKSGVRASGEARVRVKYGLFGRRERQEIISVHSLYLFGKDLAIGADGNWYWSGGRKVTEVGTLVCGHVPPNTPNNLSRSQYDSQCETEFQQLTSAVNGYIERSLKEGRANR